MATGKRTRKKGPRPSASREGSRRAAEVLRETWEAVLQSVSAAEAELEKQVRAAMEGRGAEAAARLRELRDRLDRERRKVARELESRMASVQERLNKERKSLSRVVDDAVRGALAALNIPSRQEIAELTRKVDTLSRKIDGISARPARRSPRKTASA